MSIGFTRKLKLQVLQLTEQNALLQSRLTSLESLADRQRVTIEDLTNSKASLEESHADLSKFKNDYGSNILEKDENISNLTHEVTTLQNERDSLRSVNEEKDEKIASLNTKIASTERELELSRSLVSDLTNEITQVKDLRQEDVIQNDKLITQQIALEGTIKKLERKILKEQVLAVSVSAVPKTPCIDRNDLYTFFRPFKIHDKNRTTQTSNTKHHSVFDMKSCDSVVAGSAYMGDGAAIQGGDCGRRSKEGWVCL